MSHFHDCSRCDAEYLCVLDLHMTGFFFDHCPELDNDDRLCSDCEGVE